MSRCIFAVALLTGVYCFALASLHPWDIFFGALFSSVLMVMFRRFLFGDRPSRIPGFAGRVAAFFPYAFVIVWDIITGTVEVTLVVLHVRPIKRPGIVAIPMGDRTEVGVAVSMIATTLSPGSFFIEADWEKRVMFVHVLDASDVEAVVEDHQQVYARWQRKVFP